MLVNKQNNTKKGSFPRGIQTSSLGQPKSPCRKNILISWAIFAGLMLYSPYTFQCANPYTPKCPSHSSLGPPNPQPKYHLDCVSHFWRARSNDWQTDWKPTDKTTVYTNRPYCYIADAAMQLIIKVIMMTRAVRKSRIHDRRDYRDFRHVPWFLAIAMISCHGHEYWRIICNFRFQKVAIV